MDRIMLEAEFDRSKIKRRKGRAGETWSYIEVDDIVQRLNDGFDGRWSFSIEIVDDKGDGVLIKGTLSGENQIKEQFGYKKWTVNKAGEMVDIGSDYKAAGSDALKKCASLFGVPLGEEDVEKGSENVGVKGRSGNNELSKVSKIQYDALRRSIFGALPKRMKENDEIRHQWQKDVIGKERMAEMTVEEMKKLLKVAEEKNWVDDKGEEAPGDGNNGNEKDEKSNGKVSKTAWFDRYVEDLEGLGVGRKEVEDWVMLKMGNAEIEKVDASEKMRIEHRLSMVKKDTKYLDEMIEEIKVQKALLEDLAEHGMSNAAVRVLVREIKMIGERSKGAFYQRLGVKSMMEIDGSCVAVLGQVWEDCVRTYCDASYRLPKMLSELGEKKGANF